MGWMTFVGVFIGGGAGSLLRWGVLHLMGTSALSVSLALVLINCLGSSCLGYLLGMQNQLSQWPQWQFVALSIGVLGGFTTFSSFSFDIVKWFHSGDVLKIILFFFLNNALSVTGCYLSYQHAIRDAV